ncbi:MAG: hypothetical protein SVV03_03740 [Candidatus Nanohaloarchaea archaeon]|nr:hypothetical protein [Candidatus Nanohaloarchaea archaeon]
MPPTDFYSSGAKTCVEMECIIHPDLDQKFYKENIHRVVAKLQAEESADFTFLVLRGEQDCAKVSEMAEVHENVVRSACDRDAPSSFGTTEGEFIALIVDKPFLQENGQALRGLVAHELMHTLQRYRGIEDQIENAAHARTDSIVKKFEEIGFSQEDALKFIKEVLSNAVFCLKDIFSNTELVKQGFSKDLSEYYYHMLDVGNYCPLPEFYGEEEEFDEILKAIAFDLQLIPTWLPFETLDQKRAKEIKSRIKDCYEKNIPQTAYYINDIRHLYHDQFDEEEEFINLFFEQILNSSYKLLEKKLG